MHEARAIKESNTRSWLCRMMAACLGFALAGSIANANTITAYNYSMPSGTPGIWSYGATHSSGELHAGDGFTIFDFGGYVSASIVAPAGWTAVAQQFGSPFGTPLGSDSTDINLTFTYNGPTLQSFGPRDLGLFRAETTSSVWAVDNWVSRDHLIGAFNVVGDGRLGASHTDDIIVPLSPSAQGTVGAPDGGSTVALLGLALCGMEGLRRRLSSSRASRKA